MPVDTRIPGDAQAALTVAAWLRDSLGRTVGDAASTLYAVRNSSWDGPAGERFREKLTAAAPKVEDLSTAAGNAAVGIEVYAADLRRAQEHADLVRRNASAAGLTVTDGVVQEPGPAPSLPYAPGQPVTVQQAAEQDAAVAAVEEHQRRVTAYDTALAEAGTAHDLAELATDTLNNMWADLRDKWFLAATDMVNGAAGTMAAMHSSILAKQSKALTDEAATLLERVRTATPGTPKEFIYRDFDAARAAAYSADDAAEAGARVARSSGRVGLKVGGALAVAGVAYDIYNGKPVGQAVVSGGLGFGASVAAGAAIGTLIPVPVLGTAVGAVGGAVVGLFVSGAVDSMYQNGVGSVGQAIEDGASAVADTGRAIGGIAEDAWDAIF